MRWLTSSSLGSIKRLLDDFVERHIGQLAFCSNTFAFRPRRKSRQPGHGLLLIGFRKNLAEVGKKQNAQA